MIESGTKLPWERDGRCIYALNETGVNRFSMMVSGGYSDTGKTTDEEIETVAAYAQHAANTFPKLVEALEMIAGHQRDPEHSFEDDYLDCQSIAEDALKLAKGE